MLLSNTAFAIDEAKVPKAKRTTLGQYFTAVEANNHMKKHGKSTLFIDIRDPAELHTVGMATNVDANVPFFRIDLSRWNVKKHKFAWAKNRSFAKDIALRLVNKGLSKDDTVILICGSGKRAAKGVNALVKSGYTNVYPVVDGTKGWLKHKLPWSRKLAYLKMYGKPGIPIKGPELFDDIDADANGSISKTEAKVRADLVIFWARADKNKDGKLDPDEYADYMRESGYDPEDADEPGVGAAPVE
jgi:rhodanese-related sulfurtransferase